ALQDLRSIPFAALASDAKIGDGKTGDPGSDPAPKPATDASDPAANVESVSNAKGELSLALLPKNDAATIVSAKTAPDAQANKQALKAESIDRNTKPAEADDRSQATGLSLDIAAQE